MTPYYHCSYSDVPSEAEHFLSLSLSPFHRNRDRASLHTKDAEYSHKQDSQCLLNVCGAQRVHPEHNLLIHKGRRQYRGRVLDTAKPRVLAHNFVFCFDKSLTSSVAKFFRVITPTTTHGHFKHKHGLTTSLTTKQKFIDQHLKL